jgi:hypothetical protein
VDGEQMEQQQNILTGYVRESEFAATHGTSQRTISRYRNAGMPFVTWGGAIYIHVDGARDWLARRVRRRNQTPDRRRA